LKVCPCCCISIPPIYIVGKISGKPEISYEYKFTAIDPEGDNLSYYIDWGDGNITTWTDFQISNTAYIESYSCSNQGVFTVK
jgi:hypothetical protein